MNSVTDEYTQRRAELARQIERQRTQFAAAYRDLEKPIQYAEYGMRGVGFLRNNQWIFMAAPTLVSVFFSLFGRGKGKSSKRVPGAVPPIANPGENSRNFFGRWGGRAWQLYQLYRRVRPFFP